MEEKQIQKIIEQFKKKKANEYYNYHNKYKLDEKYMIKNKQRAKEHYDNNKEKRANEYSRNKEFLKARSSYNYYKKTNNLDKFQKKFPDRVKLLKEHANLTGVVVVGLDY